MKTNLILFVIGAVCIAAAAVASTPVAPSAHGSRTIYLVRHGAYEEGARADPQLGPGLTPLGVAEARLVAARLRGLPIQFDEITSSTLLRARQTAAVIHELLTEVPLKQTSQLVECTPPGSDEADGEAGTAQAACAERLNGVFAQEFVPARNKDQNDLIVAHGNVIRYLVVKALGADTRTWTAMSVAHASVTIIRVRADGTMTVIAVGDIGHLPPNMQSWGGGADPQLTAPH